MTKRCDYLRNTVMKIPIMDKPELPCVVCEGTREQCPKKMNKLIIGQRCWQVQK